MGQPIRGMTRPLPIKASIIPAVIPPEVMTLDANFNASIHNRFDVEVIDAKTGKIKQRAQAENVICQGLYDKLASSTQYFANIQYGSGTGTPASTDTTLFHLEGSISLPTGSNITAETSIDWANHVFSCRRMGVIDEQTANGKTLTELGIYGDALCTHAMMRDMNGNQISIPKTNTDILNIYATIFVHWDSSLESQGIHMQPEEDSWHGFFGFLAGLYETYDEYANVLIRAQPGTKPALCSTTDSGKYSGLTKAWSNSNKTLTLTMTRLGASKLNLAGGIRDIVMYSNSYSYGTKPRYPGMTLKTGYTWFPGSDITGEVIGTGDGTTKDFSTKFDNPSNAQIYVDGVLSSEVIVDDVPLNYNHMDIYFEGVQIINGIVYPYTVGSVGSSFEGLYSCTYYNPFYSKGIMTAYVNAGYYLDVSDDGINWTTIWGKHDGSQTSSSTLTIPTANQNSKYWKYSGIGSPVNNMVARDLTGKNVHFLTAPPSGAVITGGYHTPVIAKDANHVFDLTVTIQLGEYTS
jgi:hypothetical protein